MARTQIVTEASEPPPGLDLSPVPNLEGVERAAEWIRDNLGIPATGRWIHDKTITGRIRYHKLMNRRYYSSAELYEFVMAQSKIGGQP
jgi:hypothetical protein